MRLTLGAASLCAVSVFGWQPASPSSSPHSAGAPGFVGSNRCRACHPSEFEHWTHDWHSRALSPATASFVVGRFDGQHFKGSSSEAWMSRVAAGFQMRTAGASGQLADFPVQWVIGGKHMQDAVTVMRDGAWQVLPVYFHVTGRGEWVDYTEAKQGAVDPGHPFFWTNFRRNVNHECLDCHTSGLRTTYDRQARRWRTEFADAGVACESCHGPGATHARTMKAADIVNPRKLEGELALAICAQCHGPREPVFPILDAAHHFRPGRRYDDYYQAQVIVDGTQRSGDFFADGRPMSSSFEYQALVQSQCYLKGKATCLTCHTAPHQKNVGSELRPEAAGDESCRQCHAGTFAAGTKHTRHQAKAAQRCVACHMPKVVPGVLDRFADHAMDVPAPENTARHGVPSACGTCHDKKQADVLQKDLLRLWPGAGKRQQRRLRLADAIDEATARLSEPALAAVIADESEAPTLRGAAGLLISQRFPPLAPRLLTPLLHHPSPVLRVRAMEGLAYARARESAGSVAGLVDDPSLPVRQTAALVLSALADPRAEAALHRLAADPSGSALPKPHQALGIMGLQRGQLDQAIAELERAVAEMPYWADALTPLGAGYYRQGRIGLARDAATDALHFSPGHVGAQRLLQRLSGN